MPSAVFTKGGPICAIPVGVPRQLIKQLFQNVIMVWMCDVPRRLVCLDIAPTGGAILEGCGILWRRSLAREGGPLREDFEVFQSGLLPGSSLHPAWELNVRRCLKLLPPSLPHSDGLYPLLSCMAFVRCFATVWKVTNTKARPFKKLALKRVLVKIQIIRRQILMMGQRDISPQHTDMASVNLKGYLHFSSLFNHFGVVTS